MASTSNVSVVSLRIFKSSLNPMTYSSKFTLLYSFWVKIIIVQMLLYYDSLQIIIFVFTYLLIYNFTSFIFFTTFLQFVNTHFITLLSLNLLTQGNFLTKVLSLSLMSLAGVPPLLGFFSKIFVVILISTSNMWILFPPFFTLLFTGLYFYIQNIRFLHSTTTSNLPLAIELSLRVSLVYIYVSTLASFILIFGFSFVDDLILLSTWALV